MTPIAGSHGKLHRTTKILSHARRRGGVAARGARAAAGQVAHDWIPGCDIAVEYRWAEGRDDRYAAFAAEFVQRRVDVIVTAGTTPTMSVKKATSTIPIVFASAGDPVGTGLVASLARPGGNVTGLSNMQTDLGGLRL